VPFYQHKCKECHHTFEMTISMSEAKWVQACPKCGGESPRVDGAPASIIHGGFDFDAQKHAQSCGLME
jgi:putative FmdB family regulatory protein